MNDTDQLTPAEQRLRSELRRTLTPPTTPFSLVAHVEDLATPALDRSIRRGRSLRQAAMLSGRALRLGLAAAALIVMVVAAELLVSAGNERTEVASPHRRCPRSRVPPCPRPPPGHRPWSRVPGSTAARPG